MLPGYTEDQARRITGFLLRLWRHLEPGQFHFAGELPVRWHLAAAGLTPEQGSLNGLVLAVRDTTSLRHTLADDFLVEHYHPGRTSLDDFYACIVDPTSRLRLHIVSGRTAGLPFWADISGLSLPLEGPLEAFASLVHGLLSLTDGQPVDGRQLADAHLMERLIYPDHALEAAEVWEARYGNGLVLDLAFKAAQEAAVDYPHLVRPAPRPRVLIDCKQCITTQQFPRSPAWRIQSALRLGW